MFCAKCGEKLTTELNFCNRCGTRVDKTEAIAQTQKRNRMFTSLAFTTAAIAIFGLAILIPILTLLVLNDVDKVAIIFLTAFYLSAVFGICAHLSRLLGKLVDSSLGQKDIVIPDAAPKEFEARKNAQLGEPRIPVMSVTEHTTRTLEDISLKQK
jgi:hypothetical protein